MIDWIKSSRCSMGDCVEIGYTPTGVLIRDSEHPDSILAITRPDWRAFIEGAKAGEFDLPEETL